MQNKDFTLEDLQHTQYYMLCRLNDICRRLKIDKNQVIALRNKGINHFKHNLEILYKSEKLKDGTKQ